MRDALSIFDQLVAFCGDTVTYRQAVEVLNVLDTDYYFRLVDAALHGGVAQALLLFDEVLRKGFDAGVFVTGLASHLRDVLVSSDAQTLPLLETTDAVRQQYAAQAAACTPQWIFAALDLLNTCDINYRTARNKRLLVELCLVRLCRLTEPAPAAPQPVRQTAVPPQPERKQAPQPAQVAAQTAAPDSAPAPRQGMPKRISLNMQEPSSPEDRTAPAPEKEAPRTAPFTADRLIGAWTGLKRHFPKEERLQMMLADCVPVQESATGLRLTLANPWQQEEFARFERQVVGLLRDELQNDLITLRVEVGEYRQQDQAFTAEEKYRKMVRRYPQLAEFKAALGLQLE